MIVLKNHELSLHNSFKLKSICHEYIAITDKNQIPSLINTIGKRKYLILGDATNTILPSFYDGVIVQLQTKNIVYHECVDKDKILLEADGGFSWDEFVDYTLSHGYFGLENLSAIPGTVGASPVQNIGAYGAEVGNYIHSVEVYNIILGQFEKLSNEQCEFKYRSSVFKGINDYIITSVYFLLNRYDQPNTQYLDLQQYTGKVSGKDLRDIVVKIRNEKLPSLEELPNAGSFFQNPLISKAEYERLVKLDKDIIAFRSMDSSFIKISAGYLIDKAGLKPYFMNGFSVYHKHALVLVNYNEWGTGTQDQLLELAHYVQQVVYDKYQVHLQIEPNIIQM